MILLVKYNGIPGGIIRGDASTIDVLDSCHNLDKTVLELLRKHNFAILFSDKMMIALGKQGFYYLTGGTSTYKQAPLLLVNTSHRFFTHLK